MRYRSVNGVIWHGSAQKVIGNQRIGVEQLRESKRDCVKSIPRLLSFEILSEKDMNVSSILCSKRTGHTKFLF